MDQAAFQKSKRYISGKNPAGHIYHNYEPDTFPVCDFRASHNVHTGKAYKDKKTAGTYYRDMEIRHHQCAVYHVKRSAVRLAGSRKHSYIQQQYTAGLAPEIRTEKNSG